jgi:hypothetical protein
VLAPARWLTSAMLLVTTGRSLLERIVAVRLVHR